MMVEGINERFKFFADEIKTLKKEIRSIMSVLSNGLVIEERVAQLKKISEDMETRLREMDRRMRKIEADDSSVKQTSKWIYDSVKWVVILMAMMTAKKLGFL